MIQWAWESKWDIAWSLWNWNKVCVPDPQLAKTGFNGVMPACTSQGTSPGSIYICYRKMTLFSGSNHQEDNKTVHPVLKGLCSQHFYTFL